MKICVLQPDYSTTDVDYKNYDPPRNISALLPGDSVDHLFLNKLTTWQQLNKLKKKKYDIFINLCEGYLHWEVPSIDVIYCLEMLNLPYTGPNTILYDPPKELMKYVSYTCGVKTPAYALLNEETDVRLIILWNLFFRRGEILKPIRSKLLNCMRNAIFPVLIRSSVKDYRKTLQKYSKHLMAWVMLD